MLCGVYLFQICSCDLHVVLKEIHWNLKTPEMLYKYAILFSHVKLTVFNCKEKTEEVYMKHIVSFLWLKKPKQWQNLTTVRSSPGTLCLYASSSSRQLWKCEKEREQNFKLRLKGLLWYCWLMKVELDVGTANWFRALGQHFSAEKWENASSFF